MPSGRPEQAGDVRSLRASLRRGAARWIKPHPRLYRLVVGAWNGSFALWAVARAAVRGQLRVRPDATRLAAYVGRQTTPRLRANLTLAADAPFAALGAALGGRGVPFGEGGWTYYLPPSPARDGLIPDVAARYPAPVGLKVLKDLRAPNAAQYTPHHLNPAPGAGLLRALTPDPRALLRVGAALHAEGLGPKVLDLVELDAGRPLTAYVVEHLTGGSAAAADYAGYMTRQQAVLARGELQTAVPSVSAALDFAPPDCNGNLVRDGDGMPRFVDFQSFRFADEFARITRLVETASPTTHFGAGRLHRGKRYLYQTLPGAGAGKRDTSRRFDLYATLLQQADVTLADQLAFDIGCNTGLMLYEALARGARWGVGFDRPAVAAAAAQLLPALGATRATVLGLDITPAADFAALLPAHVRTAPAGVLLYLAVSDHIGFPAGVAALPWHTMLYEGHADQDVALARATLRAVPWLTDADVRATGMVREADSPPRPILVVRRAAPSR